MSEAKDAWRSRLKHYAGAVAAVVLAFALCQAVLAQTPASKPPVPPGRDPGGIAIAFIATGLDYTHIEIKDRLTAQRLMAMSPPPAAPAPAMAAPVVSVTMP